MKTGDFRHQLLLTLLFFLLSGSLTVFITSPLRVPTGDEPYYLLTTHSLVVDGDISLGENHRNRDYQLFYPGQLPGRATVGADGIRVVPAHGMGLSLFLYPFYWIALHWFPEFLVPFLRLVLCMVASLCVYLLLKLGSVLVNSAGNRILVVAGITLSSPFLFYCNLFYPEIFAMLLILLALIEFLELEKNPARSVWVLALVPALLVWFHPKYVALAILIVILSSYRFVRISRNRHQASYLIPVFYFLLSLAGLFVFFLFLHYQYGSWSPDIIYGGDRSLVTVCL